MYKDILNEIHEANTNIEIYSKKRDSYIGSLTYTMEDMEKYHKLVYNVEHSYNSKNESSKKSLIL